MEGFSIIVEDDKPQVDCGDVAISSVAGANLAALTHNTLLELQHRGQNAAGIAIYDGAHIELRKDSGLVEVALPEEVVRQLPQTAHHAIGHVRYSTVDVGGEDEQKRAAHPVHLTEEGYEVALAENGHVNNVSQLLKENGHDPSECITDAEGVTRLILDEAIKGVSLEDAVATVAPRLNGAFTLVALSGDKIVGVRDGHGFRPLALGNRNGDGWALSSESGALVSAEASFVRNINRGEMVTIVGDTLLSRQVISGKPERLCLMELIYLLRPDAQIRGMEVATFRQELGKRLGQIADHDTDVCFGVPDSGVQAARGFAKETGIERGEGFVKNHYVGRTFIVNGQKNREQKVKIKLRPILKDVAGKKLDVIDDSIVRGTTAKAMVHKLRMAGAVEVHLNVTSPPYRWPCFYGLDTGTRDQLVAAVHEGNDDNETLQNIKNYLGVDSLTYLSLGTTLDALDTAYKDSRNSGEKATRQNGQSLGKSVCTACFNKDYPTDIPEEWLQFTPGADL